MRTDADVIADIREACRRISVYIRGGEDAFFEDEMVQDAVIRN